MVLTPTPKKKTPSYNTLLSVMGQLMDEKKGKSKQRFAPLVDHYINKHLTDTMAHKYEMMWNCL